MYLSSCLEYLSVLLLTTGVTTGAVRFDFRLSRSCDLGSPIWPSKQVHKSGPQIRSENKGEATLDDMPFLVAAQYLAKKTQPRRHGQKDPSLETACRTLSVSSLSAYQAASLITLAAAAWARAFLTYP